MTRKMFITTIGINIWFIFKIYYMFFQSCDVVSLQQKYFMTPISLMLRADLPVKPILDHL